MRLKIIDLKLLIIDLMDFQCNNLDNLTQKIQDGKCSTDSSLDYGGGSTAITNRCLTDSNQP